jgi:hypothetical protein
MKVFILSLFWICSALAQDPSAYLKNFDAKVYSLKTKGVKDFVVDVESPKLTKQINEQQIFGSVKELSFRIYWTANPERVAIEVNGLPEGFKEAKEELKASVVTILDDLLPLGLQQKFANYKFSASSKPKTFVAQDTTGVAPVPSFTLKFDQQDRLQEVIGNKPIGSLVIHPLYEKQSFSDGRWVLKKHNTVSIENGQSLSVSKELKYGEIQGIGILREVTITTEQKLVGKEGKPFTLNDTVLFKNYKINTGDALRYYLGNSKN